MRRSLTLLSVFALLLGVLSLPAIANSHDKELVFNQDSQIPFSALEYEGTILEMCAGVDTDVEDGWVFLNPPQNKQTFTILEVEFEDAGVLSWPGDGFVVNDKFVVFTTDPGDTLIDAGGTLTRGDLEARGTGSDFYNLTHVCAKEQEFASILIEKEYSVVEPAEVSEFTLFEDDQGERGESVGAMDYTAHENGDTRHFYCIDGLMVDGEYIIAETDTPDGFVAADDVPVTATNTETCEERLTDPGAITETDLDALITNEPGDIELTVQKLKLSIDENLDPVTTDVPLAGFGFALYEGAVTDPETPDPLDTGTSGADGQVVWDSTANVIVELEVGETFTVCETGVPTDEDGYWTDAVDDDLDPAVCQTFTTTLDTDVDLSFYNAPRADVTLEFFDVTGYTSANLWCTQLDANGDAIGDPIQLAIPHGSADGGGSIDLDELDLGDYECSIEIRNGAANSTLS